MNRVDYQSEAGSQLGEDVRDCDGFRAATLGVVDSKVSSVGSVALDLQ